MYMNSFRFWALHGTIQAGFVFTSIGMISIYCVEWGFTHIKSTLENDIVTL